jgi:hypothetical protein
MMHGGIMIHGITIRGMPDGDGGITDIITTIIIIIITAIRIITIQIITAGIHTIMLTTEL